MPIDPSAVGATAEPATRSWTSTDSILYALGIGAGVDELAFTTENTKGVEQQAYPTQAVVLGGPAPGLLGRIGEFDPKMLVHGTQKVTLAAPVPVAGTVVNTSEVTAIHDKGKGAVVDLTTTSVDEATGQELFRTRVGLFLRGAGGFGEGAGPEAERREVPSREPDHELTAPTHRDQALLYRLSGDRNPLHSDPGLATAVGFERPILHGLCTFGVAGRVLLHALADGDPTRVASMEGRFSKPVLPGDELTVRAWDVDGGIAFEVVNPSGATVLAEGHLELR